jgi:predicted nuclease of predicted toxin-antitoxin system
VRVLIDECLNWRLGRALPGHFCTSMQHMGWSGLRNGELLEKMRQERFDVLITGDRNLQFQQNLPGARVAVIVLRAGSTRLAETLPLMSPLLTLLRDVKPGTVTFLPES